MMPRRATCQRWLLCLIFSAALFSNAPKPTHGLAFSISRVKTPGRLKLQYAELLLLPFRCRGDPSSRLTRWAEGSRSSADGPEHVDVRQLVARCVQLAEEAGAKMREVQARPSLGIVDKGGEHVASGEYVVDPQTAADREVEELCVASLLAEFPSVSVVAEEMMTEGLAVLPSRNVSAITNQNALAALCAPWPAELHRVDSSRAVVYIDPLDGTAEFVKGNLVAVTNLIGIAVDGVPVAGVINQPWAPGLPEGRTVWGGPGAGVHGAAEGKAQGLLCTNRVVRSHRCAHALTALGVKAESDLRRVSATGFNFLSVIEGYYPLFVLTRHGTKKWDSCAGEALLSALGGRTTDAIGRPYRYTADADSFQNLCGLLASRSPDAHAAAAETIANSVAPWPVEVEDPSVAL
eukprot:TRINITY_DN49531_c0_g1_i1.p1 TRINITY_DN49531_c0_g1~~TRINITY_DN49531_c0_g1_i1.p1  ORF type:complete len:406 (-),score=57.35 TRINITY_DN49531_c0_g1_i1:52-1269(-)